MITRRKFLGLAASSVALASTGGFAQQSRNERLATLADALGEIPEYLKTGSQKKGLGNRSGSLLADLKCKWFYNWMANFPADAPLGIEYIPMVRSGGITNPSLITKVADQARELGITELLGLNEPDAESQDNMSVENALDAWPLLMETGMRLGSPGCVHPDKEWMNAFMEGVKKRDLRVDFVCVHSYGGPNTKSFVRRLEDVANLYDRPLWITEFAVGDWSAKTPEENRHSPKVVLRFMEEVLPMLDKLDFLERYAWFSAGQDSPPLGTSALYNAEGELTPLGECYRDA